MTINDDDPGKPCIGSIEGPCTYGDDDGPDPTRNDNGRCRDCDIEHCLALMKCPTCSRMRYRVESTGFGEYLWGERCTCEDPITVSVEKTGV